MRAITIASVLLLTLLGATPAPAQTAPGPRLAGVPAQDPRVTLSVTGPAGEVLETLAKKAGWSLTASGDRLARRVSLRIKNQPATEVLATVVEVAGLQARFGAGDSVVVQDAEAPAPVVALPVPGAPPPPGAPPAVEVAPASDDDEADEDEKDDEDEKGKEKRRGKKRGRDRSAVGEDLVINAGETVGDVVSTGGSVTVHGHATGDVVAVGGSVILEPGARVDGDAVSVGGSVEVKPGATLRGEQSSVGGPLGKVLSGAIKMSPTKVTHKEKHESGFFGRLWWTIPFFVLGFLIMLFVPDRLVHLREALVARPWAATAAGVGSWFGIVALCILLAVTLIGIPLIPIAVVGYFALGLFGLTGVAWWTGAKLTFVPGTQRPLVAFAVGTLVLALVGAIPFVGKVALWLATTVSGGAALLLLINTLRNRRRNPPPPANPVDEPI